MAANVQLNALDPNSLAPLKRLTRDQEGSPEALRAAAKQFEAMFLQMVLKSMRDAMPTNSLFDSEQSRMFQSLLDQQTAMNMAQGRGTGLADVIYRQLGGKPDAPGAVDALLPGGQGADPIFDLINVPRRPAAVAGMAAAAAATAAGQGRDAGLPGAAAAMSADLAAAIRDARGADGQIAPGVREFVNEVWPHAREASRKTGIPAHFMVAQAALETGWGRKVLRHADGSSSHNLFNIKAGGSWQGKTVDLPVTEYANGQPYRENARFRSYGSYAEAFADYANLLSNSPRYAAVLGQRDAAGFARGLQQAGYATDPMYADKLTRIIGGSTLRGALAG